jgi:hypothetical protein
LRGIPTYPNMGVVINLVSKVLHSTYQLNGISKILAPSSFPKQCECISALKQKIEFVALGFRLKII